MKYFSGIETPQHSSIIVSKSNVYQELSIEYIIIESLKIPYFIIIQLMGYFIIVCTLKGWKLDCIDVERICNVNIAGSLCFGPSSSNTFNTIFVSYFF